MTPDKWSILAGVLGFAGSLLLFYPGWRVSRSLKTIERLRAVVDQPSEERDRDQDQDQEQDQDPSQDQDERHDPGPELVEILEEQHVVWRPLEHWLLIGGIGLIILSFAADLFFVKLAR